MASIAERSQRIVSEFLARQVAASQAGSVDPFNLGGAFLEMTSRMMASPEKMLQAQLSLWQDYFMLWQSTTQRMLGQDAEPVVVPHQDDRRFRDDGSYRTWVVNRFGTRFYDIFFGPYSEKVWGVPPAELSSEIAEKRIAVRGILELLHSLLFRVERYHPENPKFFKNYYPRHGVGQIADKFAEQIEDMLRRRYPDMKAAFVTTIARLAVEVNASFTATDARTRVGTPIRSRWL